MAINIRDIARMSEFNLELKSLGTARCLSLKTDIFSQAHKKLDSSGIQSIDFVRWLFGEMVRRPVEGNSCEVDQAEPIRFTAEELGLVTDMELDEFADKLIQKYRYFLKTHKGNDIERAADESACDFLVRAFRHHAAEQKEQWDRMIEPVSKSLFASATIEAMQRNFGLSDQFQGMIDKYTLDQSAIGSSLAETRLPSVPEFHIPKNPIHETNEKLESVVKQIEELRPLAAQAAQLIRSMNDTALRMQTDYIDNAKSAGQQTRIAIWIAAVSLLVSAIGLALSSYFSYQSYVDAKESAAKSDAQINAFQSEVRELVTAQREERDAIVKSIIGKSPVPLSAVKK